MRKTEGVDKLKIGKLKNPVISLAKEDRHAILLGAYQSLLLGGLMKYYGVLAGLSQAAPFIIGLAFVGFALGARAGKKKRLVGLQWRFVLSASALGFLFFSRLYFPNLFRAMFLGENLTIRLLLLVVSVWLSCFLFSFVGYAYSIVLRSASRPALNYAALAAGFAIGTAGFGILVSLAGPDATFVTALLLGLLLIENSRARTAGGVALIVAIVAAGPVRAAQFNSIAFTWGVRDYKRVANVWSPYYKIDIITFNQDSILCGLYNYVGMILSFKRIEDVEEAARYYEAFYEATMPPGAQSALILGSGGGVKHPALFPPHMKKVVAVEIDPTIVKLMRGKFASFNRGFYSDPRVRPVVAEGRAFLGRNRDRFDFIDYESLDTRLYATSMNIVPIENTLYTREGLRQAVEHLSDDGLLRITIGTDEDEQVVRPIVSGLPAGVYYDVYRIKIDMAQLVAGIGEGVDGGGDAALNGWTSSMPQTAIIVAKKTGRIEHVRAWYESLGPEAADQIQRINIKPDPTTALTDNHPFFGSLGPATGAFCLALVIVFLLPAILFSRRNPTGRMHYFFYFIGAGYIGLEILFLVRGTRSSHNPALTALLLATMFVAGNATACAAVNKKTPGKGTLVAALVLLAFGILFSQALTSTPALALSASLVIGFLGGLFWPTALARLPRGARRAALSSDAIGTLPGIILFHGALFVSGFYAAEIIVAALYVLATFVLLLNPVASRNTV